jgi:hypothetical protein
MGMEGVRRLAASISESCDGACHPGHVELVLSVAHAYVRGALPMDGSGDGGGDGDGGEDGDGDRAAGGLGTLSHQAWLHTLMACLLRRLHRAAHGDADADAVFDTLPSFEVFVAACAACALLPQRARVWLWMQAVVPGCVPDAGREPLAPLAALVDACVPQGADWQSPFLLSMCLPSAQPLRQGALGYLARSHRGEVLETHWGLDKAMGLGHELPWTGLAADRSFPPSPEHLGTLLALHPYPLKALLCVEPRHLHGLLGAMLAEDGGPGPGPGQGSAGAPSLPHLALRHLGRALAQPLGLAALRADPALHPLLCVVKWHAQLARGGPQVGGRTHPAAPGGGLTGVDVAALASAGFPLEVPEERRGLVLPIVAALDQELHLCNEPSLRAAVQWDLQQLSPSSYSSSSSTTTTTTTPGATCLLLQDPAQRLGAVGVHLLLREDTGLAPSAAVTHPFLRALALVVGPEPEGGGEGVGSMASHGHPFWARP